MHIECLAAGLKKCIDFFILAGVLAKTYFLGSKVRHMALSPGLPTVGDSWFNYGSYALYSPAHSSRRLVPSHKMNRHGVLVHFVAFDTYSGVYII